MSNAPKRQPKLSSPIFKEGDYIALAVLIMQEDGRAVNYHLPQKLFAIKAFKQEDMMQAYWFQHPQQPVYLDQNRPDIGAFNAAVLNLHQWMIKNGYARQEGTADLSIHVWTEEEIKEHHAQRKAEHDARVLAHAEAMAAGGAEEMVIGEGLNGLLDEGTEEVNTAAINVGTIGHVDHGITPLNKALAASAAAAVAGKGEDFAGVSESYLKQQVKDLKASVELDPADPDPAGTGEFVEQTLGAIGIPGNNISYAPEAVDEAVVEMARTPQYPLAEAGQ